MAGSHYFDEAPGTRSDERSVDVVLPDVSFRFRTDRGVFSHDRLDTGTAVLLRAVPAPPPTGDLLDLGCGAGPIAITMALRAPAARVWAVDTNVRARALTARNAAALGLDGVVAAAPDEVPTDVRFAAIWSNPPIRIGKAALHELLLRWLPRLAPSAVAHLVVQRHLGADSLHRWLEQQGWPVERITSHAGYRVLAVHSTGSGPRGVDRDAEP
ncbi:MAG: methyltransferase [Ilumatobacteraceae bacterium]|nr:methyltransferase [Ilumatobacteraceae bacterium]